MQLCVYSSTKNCHSHAIFAKSSRAHTLPAACVCICSLGCFLCDSLLHSYLDQFCACTKYFSYSGRISSTFHTYWFLCSPKNQHLCIWLPITQSRMCPLSSLSHPPSPKNLQIGSVIVIETMVGHKGHLSVIFAWCRFFSYWNKLFGENDREVTRRP